MYWTLCCMERDAGVIGMLLFCHSHWVVTSSMFKTEEIWSRSFQLSSPASRKNETSDLLAGPNRTRDRLRTGKRYTTPLGRFYVHAQLIIQKCIHECEGIKWKQMPQSNVSSQLYFCLANSARNAFNSRDNNDIIYLSLSLSLSLSLFLWKLLSMISGSSCC
jgi:hypothetical protein